VDLEFSGEVWFWKGPSPWHFVTVPDEKCGPIEAAAPAVSYGWGMIPLKDRVRAAEGLEIGDTVDVRLTVDV